MHGKIKKVFFRVIHYAIMVMITVLMLMPIGWMLGTSMRQSKESFVLPPSFWPTQFNLDNFKQVFHAIPILKFAWNSLFITFLAAAFMVLFTSMAAYAFARINFKGKNIYKHLNIKIIFLNYKNLKFIKKKKINHKYKFF